MSLYLQGCFQFNISAPCSSSHSFPASGGQCLAEVPLPPRLHPHGTLHLSHTATHRGPITSHPGLGRSLFLWSIFQTTGAGLRHGHSRPPPLVSPRTEDRGRLSHCPPPLPHPTSSPSTPALTPSCPAGPNPSDGQSARPAWVLRWKQATSVPASSARLAGSRWGLPGAFLVPPGPHHLSQDTAPRAW